MTESGMGERERTHPTLALVEAAEGCIRQHNRAKVDARVEQANLDTQSDTADQ